jgi:taurine--2-oxoglutarate transaminase
MKEICEKHDIMLVCDEVMAGFYRCGTKFAFHQFDVEPDIVTFAKGATCGYIPLGGCIVNKRIADFYEDTKMFNGLTYSAHPMGCAVCVATLGEYARLGVPRNVKKLGKVLAELLDKMAKKHKSVGDARYIGLFAQVELVKDRKTREPFSAAEMAKVIGFLKKAGFATYNNENGVMVAPPLTITEEELREGLALLDQGLGEADKML